MEPIIEIKVPAGEANFDFVKHIEKLVAEKKIEVITAEDGTILPKGKFVVVFDNVKDAKINLPGNYSDYQQGTFTHKSKDKDGKPIFDIFVKGFQSSLTIDDTGVPLKMEPIKIIDKPVVAILEPDKKKEKDKEELTKKEKPVLNLYIDIDSGVIKKARMIEDNNGKKNQIHSYSYTGVFVDPTHYSDITSQESYFFIRGGVLYDHKTSEKSKLKPSCPGELIDKIKMLKEIKQDNFEEINRYVNGKKVDEKTFNKLVDNSTKNLLEIHNKKYGIRPKNDKMPLFIFIAEKDGIITYRNLFDSKNGYDESVPTSNIINLKNLDEKYPDRLIYRMINGKEVSENEFNKAIDTHIKKTKSHTSIINAIKPALELGMTINENALSFGGQSPESSKTIS